MSANLFEPFQLGGLTLTNRMVMAPMRCRTPTQKRTLSILPNS